MGFHGRLGRFSVLTKKSFGRIIMALALAAILALFVAAAALGIPGNITRVSTDSNGAQANSFSLNPSISADGRYVAFESPANTLAFGDTGYRDIFVKDTETNDTIIVSTSSGGVHATSDSYNASISADGRHVAFQSRASNLVAGDTNNTDDIFVKDRQTDQTVRVSTGSGGVQANGASYYASISADGRYVAFLSYASNLVSGDTNGTADIFVKDRQTDQTVRVSTGSGGGQANSYSFEASISADGRYVAFLSYASNLVSGDTNGTADIFVKDRQTDQTVRVSTGSGGGQANSWSEKPAISADGRYVAFRSDANNLVSGDINARTDIFVKDRQTDETVRVSTSTGGGQSGDSSDKPSISADGRYVAFESYANNLVSGDTNNTNDIFIKNRQTDQTVRVSTGSSGGQANVTSGEPAISADGSHVAFQSGAPNLVPNDTNGTWDIFVKDILLFTDHLAPQVTYAGPAGAISTNSVTIAATYSDPLPASGIMASSAVVTLDGSPLSGGCTATASEVSCSVTGLADGPHNVEVMVSDNAGNIGSGTGAFEVDTGTPQVTYTGPTATIYTNSVSITATYSDPVPSSGINISSVVVTLDGTPLSGCTATASSVSCSVTGLSNGYHDVEVFVSDNAGNGGSDAGFFEVCASGLGLPGFLEETGCPVWELMP